MNHGDVLQSQFDGMKWHFTSCFDKTFPLLRRWKILRCNKCGKTVNCSRLKLLLHAGLITHLTCRHQKKKTIRCTASSMYYNWSWLWTETSCEFLLWFCTTPPRASQKIAHFPFVYEVVHIMEPVITMDNGNEKLFTFSSLKSSGRLANYIRAFCHFLFCSFPATNIIKENNRISFRKNTTIHSIPASLSISAQLCWCSIVDSKRFSLLALSPLRVFVVVVKLCFCGISSVIASIKAPLIMKVVSFISIFLFSLTESTTLTWGNLHFYVGLLWWNPWFLMHYSRDSRYFSLEP